jgi:hypothetical protein
VRAFVAEARRGVFVRVVLVFAVIVGSVVAIVELSARKDDPSKALVLTVIIMMAILGGVLWVVGASTRASLVATLRAGAACEGRIAHFKAAGPYSPRYALVDLALPYGASARARIPLPVGAPGRLATGATVCAVVHGSTVAMLVERDDGGVAAYAGSIVQG